MQVYDPLQEKQLLQQIAEGDEVAFRQIFDLYRGKLYTFIYHFTRSKSYAEELLQDTFLTLWVNRASLGAVDRPQSYIYTIARHKTYNFLGRVARDEKLQLAIFNRVQTDFSPTEDMMVARKSAMLINQGLAQLSEQKQRVFHMSRELGMSHEEIAEALGLSKSRVKNIIVEVLAFLRVFLEQHAAMYLLLSVWMML